MVLTNHSNLTILTSGIQSEKLKIAFHNLKHFEGEWFAWK